MNALTPPPKSTDTPASTPFNPWQPPKAALEENLVPDLEKSDFSNSTAPWRAALFAPAIVIGPIAGFFMLGAWGWRFALVAAAAVIVYWLYRRTRRSRVQ
ncbi:MAG: hypothetical protein WAV95_03815 [Azonexus sp.]